MIICNIPIKAAQTLTIVSDWFRRYLTSPSGTNSNAQVGLVYFSYEPDFEFLRLSILSATRFLDQQRIKSIHIFIDQKKPFTEIQENTLFELNNKIVFEPIFNFSWASTDTTEAELKAFSIVSNTLCDEDMIAKVDSDILFMPSQRLEEILCSDTDAVGDGHHVGYQYAQGGLYFIRNNVFKKAFNKIIREKIIAAENEVDNKGEDIVISQLLLNAGYPFYLSRFMLFPDEYSLIKHFSHLLQKEFFALHFVKDKQKMSSYLAALNETNPG